jgi:hypothetical protein
VPAHSEGIVIAYIIFTALPWMIVGGVVTWVALGRVVGDALRELPPATPRAIERAQKRCRADLRRALGDRTRPMWRSR